MFTRINAMFTLIHAIVTLIHAGVSSAEDPDLYRKMNDIVLLAGFTQGGVFGEWWLAESVEEVRRWSKVMIALFGATALWARSTYWGGQKDGISHQGHARNGSRIEVIRQLLPYMDGISDEGHARNASLVQRRGLPGGCPMGFGEVTGGEGPAAGGDDDSAHHSGVTPAGDTTTAASSLGEGNSPSRVVQNEEPGTRERSLEAILIHFNPNSTPF